ncbi:hypothetical protein AK812_SmicGene30344 [Symbiodinium microadriaticum]|uniref:Uncharacterized protein n=1 Tax=Symbiodinium microadriaticum TaxID=2951 RepID=A0A1Q9CZK1_SYMMI|nr:hypothetical protein AK812_SmicGene30344 [Symbiodinium microadriaticum]CAE7171657.1 unnamed protein product [Symbiodinium microadriaticum]CAE7941299.1 unnamed protein product [Symbiodinium sp. KB8]
MLAKQSYAELIYDEKKRGGSDREACEPREPKMSACWRASLAALAAVAVALSEDIAECKDRDDRWSAYGTNCERMKAMCEDDFYGELVRSWCPLTCGACRASPQEIDDLAWSATARDSTSATENATECQGVAAEESNVSFLNASALRTELPLPHRTGPGNLSSSLWRTGEDRGADTGREFRELREEHNLSAGKAILLLEELDEAAEVSGAGPLSTLDALGKHAVAALSSTLDALSLNLMNLTQDLGNWSESEKEPKGGKGAVAQVLDFLLPDLEEEEKKVCPEGWERVLGDVYGGDQFSGGWRHSAESVEDCAWKCLTQPGCGSFEWSESRKRCLRNSQTRPTHEADRAGFVFCRRQPCPSFKTHKDCVGPGVSPGFYSKEVRMRPGSYCIWSGGACQAPMACTDSDCFLPDGGLPGMDLPSRYTLWISREGLQATMASGRH